MLISWKCFAQDLCETGYKDLVRWDRYGRTKRQLANEARRNKKVGDVPPVYPNGWFALCESDDVKNGHVLAVDALGMIASSNLKSFLFHSIKIH